LRQPAGILDAHRPALEGALRDSLPADNAPVARAARYVLGWEDAEGSPADAGGKRLRPLLTLAVAEICGAAELAAAISAAVAIELVHNFSLVHDEIQDRDAERHGRPTLWARFGEAQAINAGDLLYARALAAVGALPPAIAGPAIALLADATERMIRGQWQDLEFEQRTDVQPGEYLDMVAGKTGALIGAAAALGALTAGAGHTTVLAFERWGVAAGLAFQARDDYLGTWGDVDVTGKSNVNDLLRRKKTLPVLLALADERVGPAVRRFFDSEATNEAAVHLAEAMLGAGIADSAKQAANDYKQEAERLLGLIPLDEDARAELAGIGRLLVERDF
jgi:geranylgeranyl diphosphate synthase type I